MAETLSEYLAEVQRVRSQWKVPDHRELWFRAEDQKHEETRLQPSLYRPRTGKKRKRIGELLKLENDLYKEFGRCGTQLSNESFADDEDWEPYFMMQHHGVPTRLLDWSDGALIALHFAAGRKTATSESGSVVHVLDAWWLVDLLEAHDDQKKAIARWRKYNKRHPHDTYEDDWERLYLPMDIGEEEEPLLATPRIPLLWDSPHVSRRVAAQRSRFMIFGTDPLWLSKLARQKRSRIVPIEIPASSIAEIKRELRDAGITESVVYPDLDGLGRELKQVWEARR